MVSYSVKSPAKINLFLHITGKKGANYHSIETIFAFLNVFNLIEINVNRTRFKYDKPKVKFIGYGSKINNLHNTIMQSTMLLLKYAPEHTTAFIKVIKNIPIAAGLGGSSSDAGAIIRTLGKLWNVERPILDKIALRVGADVPASIDSRVAFAKGIGEELYPLENFSFPKDIVLVKPTKRLSTQKIFASYNKGFTTPIDWQSNHEKNLLEFVKSMKNDLQDIAAGFAPEINDIILELEEEKGCMFARMSGSGSACFGVFSSKDDAKIAALNMQKKYPAFWVRIAEII
ncbi:4-(cytidine 5'-diphospho)-2-C-methyl-D-erythritol kinase [Wolbachia endosymbiont of Pentidionis agamae]|uniref:4-(cytidine 5'-diphospho)-2-C-methyl-D-erythritol kinase n=1 Tax=Wolbachia endosymbiont of Pentidionis agamae TaxID=3110435 RepID=UPI002FCFC9B2